MYFRLAELTATAQASASVTMAGHGTTAVTGTLVTYFRLAGVSAHTSGNVVSLTMSGHGAMVVSLPPTYFRLAGVSASTSGTAVSVLMAGHGAMAVTPRNVYFRLADLVSHSPYAAYVWDGVQWVVERQSSAVTMAGHGTVAITGRVLGSPGLFLDGHGQMLLGLSSKSIRVTVLMAGHGSMTPAGVSPSVRSAAVLMTGVGVMLTSDQIPLPPSNAYLFTPPERTQVVVLAGSLRYSYPIASSVWKDSNGAWHNQETPYDADLEAADLVLTTAGPVEVTAALADELRAAGIGTITPL